MTMDHTDEDDGVVEELPWEPTQKDPLDLWSGLPSANDEPGWEIMKWRLPRYLPIDSSRSAESVHEACAAYMSEAGPGTRSFVNELARLDSGQLSDTVRALITRIFADRTLMPLTRWPELEVVELLLEQLKLPEPATERFRKLAADARSETGNTILRSVLEHSSTIPRHIQNYEVEHRDYVVTNDHIANLRGVYIAAVKLR